MNELQAAADRVRRCDAGEHLLDVYPGCKDLARPLVTAERSYTYDRDLLSDAWMAEHPADDAQGRSKYEIQLAKCAAIVQQMHPIGDYKAIGLMEVAPALSQIALRLGITLNEPQEKPCETSESAPRGGC